MVRIHCSNQDQRWSVKAKMVRQTMRIGCFGPLWVLFIASSPVNSANHPLTVSCKTETHAEYLRLVLQYVILSLCLHSVFWPSLQHINM